METILCPTDFSPVSENAVRYADELAQRMNSRLVLFHNIYEPVGAGDFSAGGMPYVAPLRDARLRKAQEEKLEALKTSLQQTDWGMPIAYQTRISYGLIGDTLPELARQVQADLVVMGHESPAGLEKIFRGSTAAEAITNLSCPVLVVPAGITFKPIHKIVFATDLEGEPFTDVALVSKVAGLFDAELLFVHVLTDQARETREWALAGLERLHKRLNYKNASFYTEANPHVAEGIGQFARLHQADMLVMGFHPRNLLQQLFTSVQVQDAAYHAFLPLLVIHYHQ
ncbi:MAG: universal stress protein [Adhaeribacter sp.]